MKPRLLEVAIADYKNLRGLRAPWSPGQVLYGANASGKTNLLECLVLLAGTRLATWAASPRLAHPRPGSISAVLEVGAGELPARVPVEVREAPDPFGAAETFVWWEALGARAGTAFDEALATAGLPPPLADLVATAARRPRIRYVLDVFVTVPADAGSAAHDGRPGYLRSYGRTLCLGGPPPAWLVEAAPELPPLFRPFLQWLDAPEDERGPHPDLLALPSANSVPLSVGWIPRTRDGAEQTAELEAALQAAHECPGALAAAADELARELALTLPEVSVQLSDDGSGLLLHSPDAAPQALDARAVDLLSDGQRVWFDEAVGSALERLADMALRAHLPKDLSDLEAEFAQPVYSLLLDADPLVRLVRGATLRVRLFDEPERHQHPRAVRRIRDALAALPTDVVVSTHSHLMLEPAGWSYLHLRRTPDGVVASALRPGELTATSPVAAEMGLTRGELLGLCQLILFVEGIHDELVLTRLFPTELREAGVVVLPMHGTDNMPMLPNLALVQDFLDCPVAVLADHARQKVLDAKRPPPDATPEELHLHRLRRAVARQRRPWRTFGLSAPDVIYYLPDQAMAGEVPGWPGWPVVAAERARAGVPVKRFVRETYGVDLNWPRIRRILDRTVELGLPRPPELARVVAEIVAFSARGSR